METAATEYVAALEAFESLLAERRAREETVKSSDQYLDLAASLASITETAQQARTVMEEEIARIMEPAQHVQQVIDQLLVPTGDLEGTKKRLDDAQRALETNWQKNRAFLVVGATTIKCDVKRRCNLTQRDVSKVVDAETMEKIKAACTIETYAFKVESAESTDVI